MKKGYLYFTVLLIAVMTVFAGCGGNDTSSESSSGGSGAAVSTEYKDGEYKASASSYDDNGYKAYANVVVKDGKVFSIDCDADHKDGGTKKDHSESGKYNMKAGGAQYEWHEEISFFEKYVAANGIEAVNINGSGKTDVVTGCTITVSDYVDLIKEALEKAKK